MVKMVFLQFIMDVRMDYRMSVILTLFKNQVMYGDEREIFDDISPEYIPLLNTSVLELYFCLTRKQIRRVFDDN